MAAGTRDIRIRFTGDAKGLQRAAGQGEKALGGWREKFEKLNRAAVVASTAVIGAAVAAGRDLVKLAADAEQSIGAVNDVFGENAKVVQEWSAQAATRVGLSANAYREMATIVGSQLANMGVAQGDVAAQTDALIRKGADLSAMFGGTAADAVEALSALLRGETDPIERYGVSIKEADINARLAAMGLSDLEGEAAKTARTQAILALLNEQTAAAEGKFAAETDTAAHKAQVAAAQWEDFRAKLGEKLLPTFTKVMGFLTDKVQPFMDQHSGTIMVLAGTLVGLATAVMIVNGAMKVYAATQAVVRGATMAWTAVQWVLNASLWASPITWIVLAIVALIAVIVLIATKTDWFKKIWSVAWDWIKNAASKVWNWLKDLPRKIGDAFGKVRDLITAPFKAAFNTIASLWNRSVGKLSFSVPSWVPGIGGKSFSMPQLPKLARGGRILESGMAIVGERGPELVHLPQGATVAPLDRAGGPEVLELHLDLGEGIRQVVEINLSRRDRRIRRRVRAGAGVAFA